MSNYPLESYKFIIMDVSEESKEVPKVFELKEHEIWLGSFLVTGMEGIPAKPTYFGKEKGRSFQDACFRYFLKQEVENRERCDTIGAYYETTRFDYDPYKNTYWGCRLFQSKEEAFDDYNKNWKR